MMNDPEPRKLFGVEKSCLASPNQVNILISGEKMRWVGLMCVTLEDSRVWSRWRVAESKISTLVMPRAPIAMNFLHGDHATRQT